jgi:hypothetical protein
VHVRIGLSILLVLLLFPLAARAKAPPLTMVTIRGPHLSRMLVITDRTTLDALGMDVLEDFSVEVAAPSLSGSGYQLIRYIRGQDGVLRVFDRLGYHVHPRSGWCGYILYLGSGMSVPSFYAGKWFFTTARGDAVMRQLLRRHGVRLTEESPTEDRQCRTRDGQELNWGAIGALAPPLLVALIGLWSWPARRNRTDHRHYSRQLA